MSVHEDYLPLVHETKVKCQSLDQNLQFNDYSSLTNIGLS